MEEEVRRVAEGVRQYDADFHVETEFVIVLHSRGGAASSGKALNTEYTDGLRAILRKLATAAATIVEMRLASRQALKFPLEQRILCLESYDFPLKLSPRSDVEDILSEAVGAMRSQCRARDAKTPGGNSTRRLAIVVQGPWQTDKELADYLARP